MEIRWKNLWVSSDKGWRKMDLFSLRKSTSSPLLKGGRKTLEAWRWDGKDPEFSFQPLKCKFLPLVGRLSYILWREQNIKIQSSLSWILLLYYLLKNCIFSMGLSFPSSAIKVKQSTAIFAMDIPVNWTVIISHVLFGF